MYVGKWAPGSRAPKNLCFHFTIERIDTNLAVGWRRKLRDQRKKKNIKEKRFEQQMYFFSSFEYSNAMRFDTSLTEKPPP